MKKSPPATLKLDQKNLLGFRLQDVEQASGTEHTRRIGSKVGGKDMRAFAAEHGSKIGSKVGNKPGNKMGVKAGSKPAISAKLGAKAGSKPTMSARIGAKVGGKTV